MNGCIIKLDHLDGSEVAYVGSHGTSVDGKNCACGCNVSSDGSRRGVVNMDPLEEIRPTVHAEADKPPQVLWEILHQRRPRKDSSAKNVLAQRKTSAISSLVCSTRLHQRE